MPTQNFSTPGVTAWISPINGNVLFKGNGAGGGGGGDKFTNGVGANGGNGGSYAAKTFVAVLGHTYNITVGAAGAGGPNNSANGVAGGDTKINDGVSDLSVASGGTGGTSSDFVPAAQVANAASTGDATFDGGLGGQGWPDGNILFGGGGGGGGAGVLGAGGNGGDANGGTVAGAGGIGVSPGKNGGDGRSNTTSAGTGKLPGGGGGGGWGLTVGDSPGAAGNDGFASLTWETPAATTLPPGTLLLTRTKRRQ